MPSRGAKQPKRPAHLIPKESKSNGWLGQKWLLKSILTGVLALSAAVYWGNPSIETALDYFRPVGLDSYWEPHQQEVREAFVTSWDAYAKYAWGKLTVNVSCSYQLMSLNLELSLI